MKSERMKKIAHLCLRLGRNKKVSNGVITPMRLKKLWSKELREVWDIVPMWKWESAHLCLRLIRSKALRRNGGDFSNVSKKIEKQGIEGRSGYCTNGQMVVSSPMSKTRPNLGSDGKWRDCSNVSKTIEKQGIKGGLEYLPNGPIEVS